MVIDELKDWHIEKSKELIVELTYRFARNQTSEVEKIAPASKTTAILTRNGKLVTTEIPISSTATSRLLAQDAAQDEARSLSFSQTSDRRHMGVSESAEASQRAPYLPWGLPPAGHPSPYYTSPYISQITPSSTLLQHTRTSQLVAELASRNALNHSRSVSRSVSRAPFGPDPTRYSSPVEGDMEEYIEWQKKRSGPRDQIPLEDAKNSLLDKLYSKDVIQGWKGDENEEKWEKLDIPAGLGRRLARDVGKWGREKADLKPNNAQNIARLPRSHGVGLQSTRGKILRSVEESDSLPDRQPDGYEAFHSEDDLNLTLIDNDGEIDLEILEE